MSSHSLLPLSDRPSPTISSLRSPSLCPLDSILSSQSIATPQMTASSSAPQIPSALDLTVKLSARATHSRCVTPLTSSQRQPSLTPTPRADGDFPDTDPVTDTHHVQEQLPIYRRPRDDSDDEEDGVTDSLTDSLTDSVTDRATDRVTETQNSNTPQSREEEEDTEESRERKLLGRFGYTKRKVITNTLQGNIFVADLVKESGHSSSSKEKKSESTKSNNAKKKKERVVVIKKTSKKLHSEHVTVQNGRKFGIYENILKECIILKHLTENRNGLIMTSFTKYENFFDDDSHYYLSMEHGGADLFDFIIEAHELIQAKKLRIKEWRKFSKYLFWQMIVVTQWLHNDMGIAHLDISLENILIKNGTFVEVQDGDETVFSINSNVQIKICDFGLAEIFQQDPVTRQRSFQCTKFCGKTNYKAPEVYAKKGVFDARKADVWSLGVVLFCMLVGSPPYNKPIASDQAYLYIKNGIIDQLLFQWERNHFITVKVLSLLHSMLDYDAESRFLVDDVVQHPWLSLYYHKYKGQMTRKSQAQRHKNKKTKSRLPFYRLPATASTHSRRPVVPLISQ